MESHQVLHEPAEYQVEGLGGLVEFSGDVEDVLVGGQGHRESVALDDAVEAELLLLGLAGDADQGAQLGYDVGHDGAASGVDYPFGTAGQSARINK